MLRYFADENFNNDITHDRATMPDFAYTRLAAGEPMCGLFVVN
jgi:hypothetical protein